MEQTPMRSPETPVPSMPSAEQLPIPEQAAERPAGQVEVLQQDHVVPVTSVVPVTPIEVPTAPVSNTHQAIESILSEGLQVEYEQLDPAMQEKFRTTGEATASQIETLLQSTKVQVQKIIALIVTWLKILPGVNSFFLQQEAKIKADKILKLRE